MSEKAVKEHGLESQAVEIIGQEWVRKNIWSFIFMNVGREFLKHRFELPQGHGYGYAGNFRSKWD